MQGRPFLTCTLQHMAHPRTKKEKKYPIHANLKLARRYLCIPATSAPSERVFSAAGLTIAKDRASLNPETADALIFLHESWDVVESYLKTRWISINIQIFKTRFNFLFSSSKRDLLIILLFLLVKYYHF